MLPPERLSYAQLADRVAAMVKRLQSLGIGRQDHVAVLMPNSVEFVESFVAMMLMGVVCVPLNTRLTPPELAAAMERADVRAVLTIPPVAPEHDLVAVAAAAIGRCSTSIEMVVAASGPAADVPTARAWLEEVEAGVTSDDIAVLLFTSGTTSVPKGCMLTHDAILRTGVARLVERRIDPDSAVWTPCPLFHVGALVPLVGCLATATTYVTTRRFEARAALELLEQERVSVALPLFPAFSDAMVEHPDFDQFDLSSLRQILATGSPRAIRRVQEQFAPAKLVSGYGMTEICGVAASSTLDDSDEQRLEWEGTPFEGIELAIADPDTGTHLEPDRVGEIVVRGYCCFARYYRDPDATAAAFDADGWFHTGDMGRRDGSGRVAFLGRYKDVMKVGGENVAAREVETFIGAHECVRHVEVVAAPHERLEEVVAAFVELEPGSCLDGDELTEWCRAGLAAFKIPRHVTFVTADSWPMSATKVDKVELRRRMREQLEQRQEQS